MKTANRFLALLALLLFAGMAPAASLTSDRVDGVTASVAVKAPVKAATTANITLSGAQTIDSVAVVAEDRVLVKNQNTASENGIYVAKSSAWQRAADFDGNRDVVKGTLVMVTDGAANAGTYWRVSSSNPITISTTSIAFEAATVNDGATVSFTQAGTGAVSRTIQDKGRDWVSAADFGATVGSADATNKAAVQAAIAAVSTAGGGFVVVPNGIDYGFQQNDVSTYPSFSSCTSDCSVLDLGPGIADGAGNPAGAQARFILNTTSLPLTFAGAAPPAVALSSGSTGGTLASNWTGTTGVYSVTFSNGDKRDATLTNGVNTATWVSALSSDVTAAARYNNVNHNGNTVMIAGNWHPALFINNTANLAAVANPNRSAEDNRRMSIVYQIDGDSVSRIGHGSVAGAAYTENQLLDFLIEFYGTALGDVSPLVIKFDTLNWSVNGGSVDPQATMEITTKTTGFPVLRLIDPTTTIAAMHLRPSGGATHDVRLRSNAGNFDVYMESTGVALTVNKTTRNTNFLSTSGTITAPTYGATVTPNAANGDEALVTVTDANNLTIANATSPSTGQLFTIVVKNTSGGAMGTITWGAGYKMAAWTNPATGFSRSITFRYDGSQWNERSRTAADVPN